jgi:hypothetical protein
MTLRTGTARLTALLMAFTALADTASAQSGTTNAELGKRIDALEMKVDALIDLMIKNNMDRPVMAPAQTHAPASPQQAAAGSTPVMSASSNAPKAMRPASEPGLTLDLYLVPAGNELTKLPLGDGIYPSASEFVASSSTFSLAAFAELPSMKRFSGNLDKNVALNWSGLLNVEQSGTHVFDMAMEGARDSHTYQCAGALVIDDRVVVDLKAKANYISEWSANRQGIVELAQGLHKFSMWAHCLDPAFGRIQVNLLSKGPNDRAPRPINPLSLLAAE